MRCRTCGYSLLGIAGRTCPECNASFRPSDFDFIPNAVQFCCPSCNQSYYGTDARGHIVPRSFACVSCQQQIDLDEMVVRAAQGFDESTTEAAEIPWEHDEKRARGFFRTVGWALIAPQKLGLGLMSSRATTTGLAFAFLVQGIAVGLMVLTSVGAVLLFSGLAAGPGTGGPGAAGAPPMMAMTGIMALGSLIVIVIAAVAWFISTILWAALTHFLAMVLGCDRRPFRITLATICYSSGCGALGWIPCIGQYSSALGYLWQIISAAIMFSKVHPRTPGRAVASIVLVPGIFLVGSIVLFMALVAGALAMPAMGRGAAGIPGWVPPPPTVGAQFDDSEARVVGEAITRYRTEKGQWPDHPAALADGYFMSPGDLMLDRLSTMDSQVLVGNRRLEEFPLLSAEDQAALVKFERAKADRDSSGLMPLGDYIFFYQGVEVENTAVRWIFVQKDRTATTLPATVVVGQSDGSTLLIDAPSWSEALAEENRERQALGLNPIPDPFPAPPVQPPEAAPDPGPSQPPSELPDPQDPPTDGG